LVDQLTELTVKSLMLTRSRTMAAPEAAGEVARMARLVIHPVRPPL